ncbi:MAG: IS200/IS605 family transposase [Bacteroidales bacterium]
MSSYRQILYHIVFRTKNSEKTLSPAYIRELYAYIMGIIQKRNGTLYRINAMEDHVHILSDLHPSVALSDFVRDIKTSTSLWLKTTGKFPQFAGWADGYAALTYAYRDKDLIVNYIKNQQEHHEVETFEQEYRRLLVEHGVIIEEKYFLK